MENQYPEPQGHEREVAPFVYAWAADREWEGRKIIVRLLEYFNEDPTRQGLIDTPRRVLKAWEHMLSGYKSDPRAALGTQFDEAGSDGIVLCKGIEMYSTCEHHLLPFFGRASVGYIPRAGRIVGLSKLARVVEVFSRRLQNQERLTKQIAEALQDALSPIAVGVVVEAEHFCMRARGVEKQHSAMVTSHMLGTMRDDANVRHEFFRLIGK